MTALSAGTDDIVAQSGITIATPDASFTPVDETYTNQSATYNLLIYENKINRSIKFRIKFSKIDIHTAIIFYKNLNNQRTKP